MINIGDKVYTPRFCTVQIKEVFDNRAAAYESGFSEPTHYHQNGWGVLGKTLDIYHMEFAAVRER